LLFFGAFGIKHIHFDDRDGRADAHFVNCANRGLREEIHIGEKDRAGFDHFKNGQFAGNVNVVGSELVFNRPNVFGKPFKQWFVVAEAA